MKNEKLSFKTSPFVLVWTLSILFLVLMSFLVAMHLLERFWLFPPLLLLVVVAYDSIQSRHSLRKNYPLIGRLRYVFESVRPEFRQYFFEGELDGKPFNRRQRSIVYQRAKNVRQTISFGMQDDPNRIGYEWAAHSNYPVRADEETFRVNIGGPECLQVYSASLLNIGAMSYGALSQTAVRALNMGAALGNFAQNTGEGGISEFHRSGGDLIWQIGTGYFGCRDAEGKFDPQLFEQRASYPEVKMIEIKLSQGAKPGHGGLLPSHKNTPEIAAIRNITPYTTVHSPAAHTAFSNAEELVDFIRLLRRLSGGKPIGIKMCVGKKEEVEELIQAILSKGSGPDFITVDGAEGGTGAAPLEFIDYMGMALSDALPLMNRLLTKAGLRSDIRLIASGKVITAFDMARNIALGADALYSARGMMFALGCIQALQCDRGTCPVGIATQEKSMYKGLDVQDKQVRVASFHRNTMKALADFIGACGYHHPSEIRPESFFRRTEHHKNQSFKEIYYS